MAYNVKSYTDVEQSKVLAKILPIESADMYYQHVLPKSDKIKHNPEIGNPVNALKWYNKGYTTSGKEPITLDEYCIPCWSLAALIDVLPRIINNETLFVETSAALWHIGYRNVFTARAVNLVDACYELILKLNELKML